MSAAGLTIALAVAMGGLAIVLNHLQARLGLVEVALNDGLPPGHERRAVEPSAPAFVPDKARHLLGEGVHLYLSRSCLACQRLLDELDVRGLGIDAAVHVRYVDRPRPAAADVAQQLGATLHQREHASSVALGIDPLPHTVAIGPDGLIAHDVTPSVAQVLGVARNAGLRT